MATTDEPEVIERPNSDSVAEVSFEWDGTSRNPEVTASLVETPGGVQTDAHTVTFDIDSGGSSGGGDDGGGGGGGGGVDDDEEEEVEEEEETETLPGSLSIDVTGTGATRAVTVTAALRTK